MSNKYLIFSRKENEDFIGFTSIEPPRASAVFYNYIKVSDEEYKKLISYFENGIKITKELT